MAVKDPVAELEPRFSSDDATLTSWEEARGHLEKAEVYWLDGASYFCTGQSERKAKNLARNSHCVITIGCNALNEVFHDLWNVIENSVPTTGVPLATRGDWRELLETLRSLGTSTLWFAFHGADEVHDRCAGYVGHPFWE